MTTLYDVLLDVYDDLGQLRGGVASGGSKTTLVDDALKPLSVDALKYGVVFITETDDGAAPQGEFAEISSFAPATGTLTFSTLTDDVESGDRYAYAGSDYRVDDMIRLVNRALSKLGDVPKIDETLSTSSTAREYTLPAAVKGGRLRRVYESQETGAQDKAWMERIDWKEIPGATYDLIFREPLVGNHTLRLVYAGSHDRVSDASDTINSAVPKELVVAWVVYLALKNKVRGEGNKSLVEDLNDAAAMLELAQKRFKVVLPGPPMKSVLVRRETRRSKYGPWLVE